jgi:hypothetical protein|tara:strand:+ start:506 stop:793 length:288 start_codon:yes stop_codon:yes gene_type:complete
MSRYRKYGSETITHKGKEVNLITSSPGWEKCAETYKNMPSRLGVVPNGMEGRPDLISYHIYGTTENWWIICVANDILDPFEDLKAGNKIRLPIIS